MSSRAIVENQQILKLCLLKVSDVAWLINLFLVKDLMTRLFHFSVLSLYLPTMRLKEVIKHPQVPKCSITGRLIKYEDMVKELQIIIGKGLPVKQTRTGRRLLKKTEAYNS